MNTDELINVLSASVGPVRRQTITFGLGIAVAAAATTAVGAALIALGPRPDFHDSGALEYLLLKLGFAVGVIGIGARSLTKLSRPGGERKTCSVIALLPFVAIMLLAGSSLAIAPSSQWTAMIIGDTWTTCLMSIPLLAVVPFAVVIGAVRRFAAPTDLPRAGAFAGLVAGGVSALAYALHCTDDSLPFVAVWYGATIAFCTLAGALLGPRVLRW